MNKNRKGEGHHFVPQFYLRKWCGEDGRMWIYPTDGRPGFRALPGKFAAENGLHDTSDVPGLESIDVEGNLGEIESLYAPRWPEVFDGVADSRTKMNLSRFLALAHLRHPQQKGTIRETNSIFRQLAEHAKKAGRDRVEVILPNGDQHFISVTEVERHAGDTEANAKAGFLRAMHASIEDLARVLHARKWGVIFADEPVFVTSDNPLVVTRGTSTKRAFGFGTSGTVATFPICPTKLLIISDRWNEDGLHYPLERLGGLNDSAVLGAGRFVFSAVKLD